MTPAADRPLGWLSHDRLCQRYRSMGRLPCSCSPACQCTACLRLADAIAQMLITRHGRTAEGCGAAAAEAGRMLP